MKSKLWMAILAVLILVAAGGCGDRSTPSPSARVPTPAVTTKPFICHHLVPAQMGECVRQELEAHGVAPRAPTVGGTFGGALRAQCIDISRWQPHPDFNALHRVGIRCVIVQSNDGTGAANPYFRSQVEGAHAARLLVGVYLFVEDECGDCQAALLHRVEAPVARDISLGAWADTEVPGSYAHACVIVATLHRYGFAIVGVYASPGNYTGGRCDGYIWPAEWGVGVPYPLAGYPVSAIELRQWCGTCFLTGIEIDRDEDRGLLALVKPAPSHKQVVERERRELHGHERLRAELHADIDRHHCRPGPRWYGHAVPKQYHTLCGRWLKHGNIEVKEIARLRRLLQ